MKSKLNLAILAFIFFPIISISEELSDVLKDAYKFYPDIEKSKTELKISEKDLKKFQKQIFYHPLIFQLHKEGKSQKAILIHLVLMIVLSTLRHLM